MRKKYLSALLFGALLLASAGTFTSCKDYDDDIKNLQEQINTVKTSLDELTTKVNNLGAGVTDFKYENGQLVIVTDKGTNFTVDMPECEGIVKLEIKDGVLYADGVAVGNVAGDGGSVVEVKDGVIYIDGKAAGELGNKVAVKDNGDGTYTLTVDDETYVLPKAVAGNVKVNVFCLNGYYNTYFTEIEQQNNWGGDQGVDDVAKYGIAWGSAANAVAWTGPKGAVTAGQFLVGQISKMMVQVTPRTTQLDAMKLQLVDTKGEAAPVVITAVPVNTGVADNTGSRATDANGQWYLYIAMDETVTAANMGTAFAVSVDGTNLAASMANKKYALSCDGEILSSYYDIVVDTDEKATKEATSLKAYESSKVYVRDNAYAADNAQPLNSSIKLEYRASEAYDYKFTIAEKDVNDAEKWGVKLENNVLTASDNAANQTVHLNLSVLGVDGNVYSYEEEIAVKFGTVSTSAEELGVTNYKVDANSKKAVVINLGETFSGLTAAQATSLLKGGANWTLVDDPKEPEDQNRFIVDKSALNSNITYYQDEACTQAVTFNDSYDNIKKIKYAKIDVKNADINTLAKPGDYTLKLVLSNANGEVKKVLAPVTITLPTFDELFAKSAAWTDGVATIRLNANGEGDFLTLYKNGTNLKDYALNVKFNTFKVDGVDKEVVAGSKETINEADTEFTITKDVIDNNAHTLRSVSVNNVEYKIHGVDGFVVKSGSFTVNFLTALDGAKLTYYVNGKETQMTVNGTKGVIRAYGSDDNGIQGVAIVTSTKAALNGTVNKVQLTETNWESSFDAKAGNTAVATVKDGALTIDNLASSASGNYTTEMTLTYVGIVSVGGNTVNSAVKATVNVNN